MQALKNQDMSPNHGPDGGLRQAMPGWLKFPAALCLALACGTAFGQSGTSQVTRSIEFEYDPVKGLVTLERIDPSLATCVEKSYHHDEFGNRDLTETRPCPGVTAADQMFEKRVTWASTNPPSSQAGVSVPANSHRQGAYTTATEARDAQGHVLSRSQTVYDVRFGTAAKETAVALGDPAKSLSSFTEYDGLGRVVKETSAIGTSVEHRRFYCKGSLANAPSATCIAYSEPVPVSMASGRLVDVQGVPTGSALAVAETAYYLESTPRDKDGSVMGGRTRVHYDSLHREIAKETEAYDGRWVRTLTAYDQLGLAALAWHAHFVSAGGGNSAPPSELRQWTAAYDELHRPLERVEMVRTVEGGPAQPNSVYMTYNGLESTATIPAGRTIDGAERRSVSRKNAAGQTAQTLDAYGATLSMAYDAVGQLVRTVDALGNVTSLEYTAGTARFKVAMNDPNAGRWTYTYDALGQLKSQRDAKSQETAMTYDGLGRLRVKANASLRAEWHYDRVPAGSPGAGTWCAHGFNRLCESTAGTTVLRRQRMSYDDFGRPVATETVLDRAYTSRVTYHPATGAVSTQTYPSGFAVQHTYSDVASGRTPGFLVKVADSANANRVFWRIDSESGIAAADVFNAQGQLQRARLGNGVSIHNGYDPISGKALTLTAATAGGDRNVLDKRYEYDTLGNIVRRVDGITAVTDNLGYDRLDRLTRFEMSSSGDAAADRVIAVAYNAVGNVLSKSDLGGYTYNATGSVRPHAVQTAGGTSYHYDANGSLTGTTGIQTRTNVWTHFNQPESMSYLVGGLTNRVEFLYDGEYKRVQETVTNGSQVRTTWMIHPDNAGGLGFEREEVRVSGTLTRNENRHFISVGGVVIGVVKTENALAGFTAATPLVGTIAGPSRVEYWHKDALGSIVAVSTGDGGTVAGIERMAFDPWGRRLLERGRTDPSVNPAHGDRGFTGHEHLDELALVHMNGRVYDPVLGRFLSVDPLIQSPDDLQNYNRYSYVLNNPLRYTDASGNCIDGISTPWCIAMFVAGTAMIMEGNQYWRMVGTLLVGAALGGQNGLVEPGMQPGVGLSAAEATAINGAIAGGYTSALASGGDLEATMQGAFFGAAFAGAGMALEGAEAVMAHAMLGCLQGELSGGGCGPSAMAAAFGKLATQGLSGPPSVEQFLATTIAGGTASVLGGGKFANGAFQAAFGYILNQAATYKDSRLSRADRVAGIAEDTGKTVAAEKAVYNALSTENRELWSARLDRQATIFMTAGGLASWTAPPFNALAVPLVGVGSVFDMSADLLRPQPLKMGTDAVMDFAAKKMAPLAGPAGAAVSSATHQLKNLKNETPLGNR